MRSTNSFALASVLILILLPDIFASVPITHEWTRSITLSSNNSQVAADIATDSDGSIYVTGHNAAGFSESDMVTVKYNSAGEFQWGRAYYNPAVAYSHEKGKCIAAYENAGRNYVYAACEVTYSGFTQYLVVVKYDEEGNQIWARGIYVAAFGQNHILKKVIADAAGNVYVTGGTSSKLFVSKFDSSGTAYFSTAYDNPSGYTTGKGNDIKTDNLGNIYVCGEVKHSSNVDYPFLLKLNPNGSINYFKVYSVGGNIGFNDSKIFIGQSGNIYTGGKSSLDYFFIKYNSDGDTIWTRRYNGSSGAQDYFNSAFLDGNENLYATGRVNGVYGDVGTVKYDSSGVFQWVRTYAGPNGWADEGKDVKCDSVGNVFVAGYLESSVTEKSLLLKYDPSGNLQWTKQCDFAVSDYEESTVLVIDKYGNPIATGTSGYNNICDYATFKCNSSGDLLWARKYNSAQTSTDAINSIAGDEHGNIYAIGRVRTGQSGDNFQIVKYNSAGVKKWDLNHGGFGTDMEDAGNAITVDKDGYIYYTGTMQVSATGNMRDVYTAKLDSNGNRLWPYPYGVFLGAGGNDEGVEIATDYMGNVYVGYNSEITSGNTKYGVRKYNSSGATIWGYGYAGTVSDTDKLRDMKVDKDGNVYLLGNSKGTASGIDIVTIKISSTGTHAWTNIYNGDANADDDARSIDVDNNGNVYVTGSSLNYTTGNDIVVIKYNSGGSQQWDFNRSNGSDLIETGSVVKYDSLSSLIKVAGDAENFLNYDRLANYYLALDSDGTVFSELISNPSVNDFVRGGSLDASGIMVTSSARATSASGYDLMCQREGHSYNVFNGSSSGNDFPSINESVFTFGNYFYAGVNSFDSTFGNAMTIVKYRSPVYLVDVRMHIQGFYDVNSGYGVTDTVRVFLRSASSPYNIVDSSKALCTFEGITSNLNFLNISGSSQYYVVVAHRNSIETWSKSPVTIGPGNVTVDFRDIANVYGNNLISVTGNYSSYCIYNGDVNQDGTIDATDLSAVDNDAANFNSGYVVTDLTGDNFVDGTDFAIADNNAANFVSAITP
jgi:uncharacterized delta-60 repeat protein